MRHAPQYTSSRIDAFLDNIAEALDIPPSKHKQAVDRYESIGEWLDADDSPLQEYSPEVYPQGSFRLGTVVRPVKEGEEVEFDIDLVCKLDRRKEDAEPGELKHTVGDRLKEHDTYRKMLKPEGRRCWTLQYAEEDGVGFHMDILPALPEDSDYIGYFIESSVEPRYAVHALSITDKDDNRGVYAWSATNPKGYAQWFDEINKAAFQKVAGKQKRQLFEKHKMVYASVEDVPDNRVRTPLQRAIQILKRHRDMRFSNHKWEEEKPISIIITTLAARAYNDEETIQKTLNGITDRIRRYSETNIIERRDGNWFIPNPVNPKENFADRWNDQDSKMAEAFFQWLDWFRTDFKQVLNQPNYVDMGKALEGSFGERAVTEAVAACSQAEGSRPANTFSTEVGAESESALRPSHCEPPDWPMVGGYSVEIKGFVEKDRGREEFYSDRAPLPKGESLRFRADTDAPAPDEVHWQVVNTGKEAREAGDLRGDIEFGGLGKGGLKKSERTRYTGKHWIECFIIKNGACVARSGKFIVKVK